MLFVMLSLVVSAAPPPIKLAATRLNAVDASAERADFYTEFLADRLAEQGVEVTSPREVAALLGLERERQLLGCDEASSCISELAGALGVDALMLGDVAKLTTGFHVNVKLLSASTTKRLATFSASARDEEELMKTLTLAAQSLAAELSTALGRPLFPKAKVVPGVRRWWWAPALVGVAAGGAGAVGLGIAAGERANLANGVVTVEQAPAVLERGQQARALGWVGVGVGVAALGTAAAFLLFGADTTVTPSVSVTPAGAVVGVQGVLP